MANINLLPVEEKAKVSFGSIQRRVLFGSIVLTVVTGVVTLGILGYFSTLSSARDRSILQVEQSAQQINSYKSTEELLVVIHDKVSDSQKIRDGRLNIDNVFSNLSKLIPQGVYFSDIKFAGNSVSVIGKARTSADAAGLVSSLVSAQAALVFSDVNMDSLATDENGNYTFSLSMNLVSNEPEEEVVQ